MSKRHALPLVAVVAVAACSDSPTQSTLAPSEAPSLAAAAAPENAQVIPGRFIVTLREGASPSAVAAAHGVRPDFVYSTVLNGFAGSISDAARDGLLRDARVSRVEPDGVAQKSAVGSWGLDRIDQRSASLNGTYAPPSSGAGVRVYIIDSGVELADPEFTGRITSLYDAIDGGPANDCDGHGTHVAGTVGGTTYGVAKSAQIVAVRVLNCSGSGTWSGVIAGMDSATAHHNRSGGRSVANMSLGGGANSSVDAAVNRMINAGIVTAVAAGNGNNGGVAQDACKYSPARVPNAITVGATTQSDTKTSWSNYGACVDLFAPGYQIVSAWIGSNPNTISGTSMASPHVAGAAALHLARFSSATVAQVRDALVGNATPGVKNSKTQTANSVLLYTNY